MAGGENDWRIPPVFRFLLSVWLDVQVHLTSHSALFQDESYDVYSRPVDTAATVTGLTSIRHRKPPLPSDQVGPTDSAICRATDEGRVVKSKDDERSGSDSEEQAELGKPRIRPSTASDVLQTHCTGGMVPQAAPAGAHSALGLHALSSRQLGCEAADGRSVQYQDVSATSGDTSSAQQRPPPRVLMPAVPRGTGACAQPAARFSEMEVPEQAADRTAAQFGSDEAQDATVDNGVPAISIRDAESSTRSSGSVAEALSKALSQEEVLDTDDLQKMHLIPQIEIATADEGGAVSSHCVASSMHGQPAGQSDSAEGPNVAESRAAIRKEQAAAEAEMFKVPPVAINRRRNLRNYRSRRPATDFEVREIRMTRMHLEMLELTCTVRSDWYQSTPLRAHVCRHLARNRECHWHGMSHVCWWATILVSTNKSLDTNRVTKLIAHLANKRTAGA